LRISLILRALKDVILMLLKRRIVKNKDYDLEL
jgi:hypothetical protein